MKTKKTLVGNGLCLMPYALFLFFTLNSFSQNIGINNTGAIPKSSALLDVDDGNANNKGILIPRVSLVDVNTFTPITGINVESLIVYDSSGTATGSSGKGYYYWSGSKWINIPAPSNGPGTTGQVLASQGSGNSPTWKTLSGGNTYQTGSALGSAMTTAYMDSVGLFTPHAYNKCNHSTEAFIPLYTGCTVGYCIEKTERTTDNWTNAVRTCLAVGKRLPEPEEWQVACDLKGDSILTMTDNWEWASNFALPMYVGSGSGMGAAIFGSSGCGYADWGWLGSSTGSRGTFAFRCVH